jgi:predicted nucleic acid-binding protein
MAVGKKLIALDTNVVLDLAGRDPSAHELRCVLQNAGYTLVITPTVVQELAALIEDPSADGHADASDASQHIQEWQIIPQPLPNLRYGLAEQFSEYVRKLGILPMREKNDGEILAEASLVDATFLVSSDKHMRDIDQPRLTLAYQDKHLDPVQVLSKKKMLQVLSRIKRR